MLCKHGHNWCKGIAGSDDKQCTRCYAVAVFNTATVKSLAALANSQHNAIEPSPTLLSFDSLMERLLAMDSTTRQRAYTLLHASGCKINR